MQPVPFVDPKRASVQISSSPLEESLHDFITPRKSMHFQYIHSFIRNAERAKAAKAQMSDPKLPSKTTKSPGVDELLEQASQTYSQLIHNDSYLSLKNNFCVDLPNAHGMSSPVAIPKTSSGGSMNSPKAITPPTAVVATTIRRRSDVTDHANGKIMKFTVHLSTADRQSSFQSGFRQHPVHSRK